uniref:Uncharacterized protein n=1 Tax=Arundo donax TaxID=35708 RepID=A0A0A9CLI5_ARUDO
MLIPSAFLANDSYSPGLLVRGWGWCPSQFLMVNII